MTVARLAKLGSGIGCMLMLLTSAHPVWAVTFDLATATGAAVTFTGNDDSITFSDNLAGEDFVITDGALEGPGRGPREMIYSGKLFSEYIARSRALAWLKRPNHAS
jgi:hypothetical protein